MSKNEPAFPIVFPENIHSRGMTLRDWFAGMALREIGGYPAEDAAEIAYKYADAMIAERDK